MRIEQAGKIDSMRRLAQRLRLYAGKANFAAHADRMALVAQELDAHADKIESQKIALQ